MEYAAVKQVSAYPGRLINCCLNSFAFKFPVIANQSADWCGNPPVKRNQVTITTKNRSNFHFLGTFRYISPLSKGIATPVCALARNDSIFFKQQFICSLRGE